MSLAESELVNLGRQFLYQNYRQPPLVLVRGEGCRVWDASGNEYLDMMAGIAVNTLGHAHPRMVEAIAGQAAKLTHLSNYFFNETNVQLAERLCTATGMARAFFCNSGTEAIEACLKLARRYFFDQGQEKRHRVIAFSKSFHGRTMGALAATGQEGYRNGFGPLGPVTHVPYGDIKAVEAAFDDEVCAVLIEPVQGEGGVIPAPEGFLAALRRLTSESGALLIADEIQTGIARTGRFLACEHAGVAPDLVALAKGLGGGVPIGAMVCQKRLEHVLPPGSHGTTFGGNPLASAAGLAVLNAVEELGLAHEAERLGSALGTRLTKLVQQFPNQLVEERGLGLLRALELKPHLPVREVLGKIRERGVLLTAAGGTALRFCPALIVSEAQLDQTVSTIADVLRDLS